MDLAEDSQQLAWAVTRRHMDGPPVWPSFWQTTFTSSLTSLIDMVSFNWCAFLWAVGQEHNAPISLDSITILN